MRSERAPSSGWNRPDCREQESFQSGFPPSSIEPVSEPKLFKLKKISFNYVNPEFFLLSAVMVKGKKQHLENYKTDSDTINNN